ncbi:MAG: hypothetical protein ACLGI9_22165 [Thermoanaerobaculia bacterium]
MRRILLMFLLLLASLPALEAAAEIQKQDITPLKALHRFPPQPLGEEIHPAVARAFEWFWKWYDSSPHAANDVLRLGGGLVVDGEPHDFSLDVRQRGDAQVYVLDIQSFGKLTLTANRPLNGRQELQFELQREGEEGPRSGTVTLKAE